MIRLSRLVALTGVLAATTACSNPELEKKVADLEKTVAELEDKVAKGGGAAARPQQQNNEEAMALYKAASEAARSGDSDTAKEKLEELTEKFKGSRVAAAGQRLLTELNVVGKKIDELAVEEWYVGESSLADGKATLVVFWEVWCPHCKREVPKLQQTFETYGDQGLNLIGLTKLTRGKTPDEVKTFIADNNVSYPMGKESGEMSQVFGVSGVPAAAVVKDGEVVWRGHPAQINDDMIKGWIN